MDNDHIKVDTASLRLYAKRISIVNKRLNSLNSAVNRLFWQVGLLDLRDIFTAGWILNQCTGLNETRNLLNGTAQRFELAENQVRHLMGG